MAVNRTDDGGRKYIPRSEMIEVYKVVLMEAWHDQTNHLQSDRMQLLGQIKELEGKLSYIRDLLSSKQLDPADFREMKTEYSNKLEKLEAKLSACDSKVNPYLRTSQTNRFFANALPDPLFKYLSNSNALYLSLKAM